MDGRQAAPSFAKAPPPEYHPFFSLIEATAAGYCCAVRNTKTDQEFEQFSATARHYMSVRDISQAEFEAVVERLHEAAKHHQAHVGSINYFQDVLRGVLGA